ncbi:hypothetical protein PsgB076_03976 [Pseudomonas savastanoi pv. glycinea str. B076]|nr:hypothetical protein PsgB076_03976 [Pseudomonas savastanoi pv. glycinea str. B076]
MKNTRLGFGVALDLPLAALSVQLSPLKQVLTRF